MRWLDIVIGDKICKKTLISIVMNNDKAAKEALWHAHELWTHNEQRSLSIALGSSKASYSSVKPQGRHEVSQCTHSSAATKGA